ncbi:MAG TPA: hypothetical protein VFG14_00725 [Chthoniobacteraceae bacterium]|nr:hypothetical protein [Chthoniobacteraceae bacterium]
MDFATRWLSVAVFTLLLPFAAFGQAPDDRPVAAPVDAGKIDMEQVREELGVNDFTAPSIEHLLAELMDLRPIPIEKTWKDVKADAPQDRAVLALSAGRVIADGLLAVIAEKPSRLEPAARALMRYAKGLGVSDHVTKHSKSVVEKAAREDWGDVRRELVRAQADVEAGMMALKDEEIAHLVSLGGWMRGLDILSVLVLEDYTPERAQKLVQPEALAYFVDRASTLNPRLKKSELFLILEKNLREIQSLIGKPDQQIPSKDDIKAVRKLASDVVDRM